MSDVHEIPFDSNSSVGTGSPTLLNTETSDVRSSLGSSHGTPTVKFAPLPHMDPARKRSTVPLGVSGRSRRKQAIQQEAGPLLWSTDPDMQEENMEDPLITFAKFVKRTSKTLWQRMRKGSKVVISENESCSAEPVLDIRSPNVVMAVGDLSRAVVGEDERRRASWSPSDVRRTLSLTKTRRRKSDSTCVSETL